VAASLNEKYKNDGLAPINIYMYMYLHRSLYICVFLGNLRGMRPRRRKPGDIAKDACRAGKDGNLLQLRFISNYKGTRPTLLLLLIYFYKCLCMPVFICRGTKKLRHLLVKIIQVTIVT